VAISYTITNCVVILPLVWISIGRNGPVTTRFLIETSGPHWVACIAAAVHFTTLHIASRNVTVLIFALAISYSVYVGVTLAFAQKRALARRLLSLKVASLRAT
jgi:PST family polysaccharide transporter